MIRRAIPNLFTLSNLMCGVLAIISSFNFTLISAIEFIVLALIFDFIDGLAARVLNTPSDFGKQLDSLADIVSFGVAPACIMYNYMGILNSGIGLENYSFQNLAIYAPLLIPVFAALRLAKFNIDEKQKSSFIGLPSPAAGIFVISWPWIYYNSEALLFLSQNILFLTLVCIITSLLMVAPIEMFALKFENTSWRQNKIRMVFLILSIALLTIFFASAIPLIILLYIILSIMHIFTAKSN